MNSILKQISITDIEGFSTGQAENTEAGTGRQSFWHRMVPVQALISGAAVRASRESGLPANPLASNDAFVHAVVLSGVLPSTGIAPQASCGIWKKRTSALKPAMGLCRLSVLPGLFDLGVGWRYQTGCRHGLYRTPVAPNFKEGNHGAGTSAFRARPAERTVQQSGDS